MDPIVVALLVLALVLGGLGYWIGQRPVTEWRDRYGARDAEAKELDGKLRDMVRDLAAESERAKRADGLAQELDTLRARHGEVAGKLASLESGAQARERALEERYAEREKQFERELARLTEAEEKLQTKFDEIGKKMLEGANAQFLEGAHSRLEALNKESLAALEKKVGPVGETLERYRKRVEELEKSRAEAWHQLQGVIGEVRAGQERVLEGANRISTTLRGATKARGDWGELQFENLLESCGLLDQTDFDCQVSVPGGEGLLRPDGVIKIPGGRKLIVDVKNVFNTYAAANEATSEEERTELLRAHARDLRGHIDELSGKRYQDYVEGSADFVVMFVPGEHVLYSALTQDSGLLEYALQRQVVLSSPLNFMSIALTVATIWRQAGVQADAKEIAELGKELYDRLARMGTLLGKVGTDLARTNKSFNSAVASFESRLVPTGRKFQDLSVDTNAAALESVAPLEIEPRQLMHVEGESAEDQ